MSLESPAPATSNQSARERAMAAVLRGLLRSLLLPTFRAGRPVADQRRRLETISRLMLSARGVDYAPAVVGNVRGERAVPRADHAPDSAVLYLHGGAYCVGSPATHRAISSNLAKLASTAVFVADYRLAPEHPFPAAVDDAVAAYRGLCANGYPPGRVALAGDSAGGGLALATALRLRELGEPLPAAIAVLSPWVDLGKPDRGPVPAGEVMISPAWVEECALHYLAGRAASEPLASPIYAALAGLPPVLIQVGTDEVLLSDSRRLHEALVVAGVASELQVFSRRWHVFQASAGLLRDADDALASVARFLRARWSGQSDVRATGSAATVSASARSPSMPS